MGHLYSHIFWKTICTLSRERGYAVVLSLSSLHLAFVSFLSCRCLLLILVSRVLYLVSLVSLFRSVPVRVGVGVSLRRSCLCLFPHTIPFRIVSTIWSCFVPCCRLLSFIPRLCPFEGLRIRSRNWSCRFYSSPV